MTEFKIKIVVKDNVTGIVVTDYEFNIDNFRTRLIADEICMRKVKKDMLSWRREQMIDRYNLTAEQADAIIEEYHIDLLSDYTFEIAEH